MDRVGNLVTWTDLLDQLVGALLIVIRRVHAVHLVVRSSIEEEEGEAVERLRSTAAEVMVNICDQVDRLYHVHTMPK